jgi:hypothetical protein
MFRMMHRAGGFTNALAQRSGQYATMLSVGLGDCLGKFSVPLGLSVSACLTWSDVDGVAAWPGALDVGGVAGCRYLVVVTRRTWPMLSGR